MTYDAQQGDKHNEGEQEESKVSILVPVRVTQLEKLDHHEPPDDEHEAGI